ncbi:MAG: hypothetical protein AAFR44_15420, partial [Pseudomonadota bacterium]
MRSAQAVARVWRQGGVLAAALVACLMLSLTPAMGQISPLDFGTLLGDEPTESEAPPQQSRPFTGFRSTEGNSAEDYRRAFSSEALAV